MQEHDIPNTLPSGLRSYQDAVALYGPRATKYRAFFWRTDPLADETVAAFSRLPAGSGRRLLEKALDEGIASVPDAPAALRALFDQLEDVPFWVDWDQLDLGGATFLRSGALGVLCVALLSLPLSYSSPTGNKPLVFSGRLLHRAPQRLGETGRFVYLTSLPGALRRQGEGFKVNVKVRLIHAQVRRLLQRSERWDRESWGEPVNQCYLAATNLMLSVSLLDGMRRFGLHFSEQEREALMQLWRYSGYLCGIEPELLCVTEHEGRRLLDLVFALERDPDEDSLELIRSVPHTVGWPCPDVLRQLFFGVSYELLGDRRARSLQYPRNSWRYVVPALRPLLYWLDFGRRCVPGGQKVVDAIGWRGWKLAVRLTTGGSLPDFRIPQRLAATAAEGTR